MLTVVGIVLIIVGCAGIGLSANGRMTRRVAALRSMSAALELLGHELDFRLAPLEEVFSSASQRVTEPASAVFRSCAEKLRTEDRQLMSDIWSLALRAKLPELEPREIECLQRVGAVLGRFDAQRQQSVVSAAAEQLEEYLREAADERNRKGRLYGTVSAAAGLFLVIILL